LNQENMQGKVDDGDCNPSSFRDKGQSG